MKDSSSSSSSNSSGLFGTICIIVHTYTHTHTVVAFLVALNQNKELLGNNGLLPIPLYLKRVRQYVQHQHKFSSAFLLLQAAPTVLWWVEEENIDTALDCIAYAGMGLSAILVILGAGNAVIFSLLWILYHSLSNVGQRW